MIRLGHAGRVDTNHAAIVAAFRALGCSVVSIAGVGNGCPDLVVGVEGQNLLVEVKNKTAKLTPDEERFLLDWRGWLSIVRNEGDASALVERVRGKGAVR